jgi:hypothetical protein
MPTKQEERDARKRRQRRSADMRALDLFLAGPPGDPGARRGVS